jgi:hypothetical protein
MRYTTNKQKAYTTFRFCRRAVERLRISLDFIELWREKDGDTADCGGKVVVEID